MNVLVVYESGYGQAERVAQALAQAVRGEGHRVEVARASSHPSPQSFDAVIAGGSVRIGDHQRPLVEFCREHRDLLVRRPSAFFSVSVSARRPTGSGQNEVAKGFSRFIAQTGWAPQRLWPIPGALCYTRYPPLVKAMLLLIALISGGDTDTSRDHEYTDWKAVEALGREFARTLTAAQQGEPLPAPGPRRVEVARA
jgi:menaquinone-dependent protoporphyrinogen oxidase